MSSTIQRDLKFMAAILLSILAVSALLMSVQYAAVNLGMSASTATLVYTALQYVSWGATAAGIIASFGIGAFIAQAVWSYVKKHTLKQFLQW
ncbi:hypothetical protein P4S80_16740 [Aeribacillus composti]|jgi:uncharacterized membrane protein|uniref:hypothetical protein n=1 Tax=Aeribacillus composti TaxID=1868734 RepID=UPI002E1A6D98|nr:hypothetical protein [Aeribacillus composti]MED0747503.1 hypothetical protein [Aeribacillus composti]